MCVVHTSLLHAFVPFLFLAATMVDDFVVAVVGVVAAAAVAHGIVAVAN